MSNEEFSECLTSLCKYYNKKLNEEQVKYWKKAIGWMNINDFDYAIDRWKSVSSISSFPTIAKILELGNENRGRRSSKNKQTSEYKAKEFFKPEKHDKELGRMCINAWNEVFAVPSSQKSRKKIVALKHYSMIQRKYPHLTFHELVPPEVKWEMDQGKRYMKICYTCEKEVFNSLHWYGELYKGHEFYGKGCNCLEK